MNPIDMQVFLYFDNIVFDLQKSGDLILRRVKSELSIMVYLMIIMS